MLLTERMDVFLPRLEDLRCVQHLTAGLGTQSSCRDVRPAYKVNVTEPAAGNYYPLTAAMYIQDKDRQLAVLTERGQGACWGGGRRCRGASQGQAGSGD